MSERDSDSENEDQEYDDELYDCKKNAAVILIDVGSTMFDVARPFKKCLAAVFQIMDRVLLRGYRRNISVCFLKDEDIVLTGFNDNLVDSVKKILHMLKQPISDLKQKYERQSPVSLRNTLSECMRQFHNLEKINPYIVILTDDDDPQRGDQNQKLAAINVALSLKELNAKLVVLPLKDGFDDGKIYKELMQAVNDVPVDIFDDVQHVSYTEVEDIVEILESVVQNRASMRRYVFRLYNNGDKSVSFWVQVRYFGRENHLYQNINISRVTNNKVKSEFDAELNVDPDKTAFICDGSDHVLLDRSTRLSANAPLGFTLKSVNDRKQSNIHHLDKRGFILEKDDLQPAEDRKQGMFEYMWQYCRDKNKYLLCVFHQPGHKTVPKLVELSANTFKGKPCFIGTVLINEDEDVPMEPAMKSEISEENDDIDEYDLTVMSNMVDSLKIKYNPHQWTCVQYDMKASLVKAQLLDADENEVTDCFPTDSQISDKLSYISQELGDIFGEVVTPPKKKPRKKEVKEEEEEDDF